MPNKTAKKNRFHDFWQRDDKDKRCGKKDVERKIWKERHGCFRKGVNA